MCAYKLDPVTLAALQGSRLVAPPGPIASAPPAANFWGRGGVGPLYWCADDNKPYVSVRAFNNEGVDYGDWGRPTGIPEATTPDKAFSIRMVIRASTAGLSARIISLSDSAEIGQWSILQKSNSFVGIVGSPTESALAESLLISDVICESNGTSHRIIVNGQNGGWAANGMARSSVSIFLGGRTDGVSANWEGETFLAQIKNASGQCLACFNANSPTQWDGGATAYDSAGNPIVFTDGVPTGRVAYSWVPLESAKAWGLFV